MALSRSIETNRLVNKDTLQAAGLDAECLCRGVTCAYETLDALDQVLLARDGARMADIVELTNLSSMFGNLLRDGIAKASNGVFEANGPHKYPDLLARGENAEDIEIKVALENNKPKGHLAKPGYYVTVRYVLGDESGSYVKGPDNRGNVVWIWEVRFGLLGKDSFNLSSTAGDSGKTAVVSAEGMKDLNVIYCALAQCPYSQNGRVFKSYKKLYADQLDLFE